MSGPWRRLRPSSTLQPVVPMTNSARARGLGLAPVSLVLSLALAACGDDRPTAPSLVAPPTSSARVALDLERDTLYAGTSRRYSATVYDADGAATAGLVAWRSLAPAIAEVAADGTVRAVGAGETRVIAQSGNRADTVALVVRPAPAATFASMEFVPSRLTLVAGARWPLDVTFRDAAGVTLTARATRFRMANPAVARVDAAGNVTALAPGATWLVATSEGREDSIPVRVGTAPSGAYDIDLRVVGAPDPRLVDVMQAAARRWEGVIVGDLPNVSMDVAAGACGDATPALQGTVDDLAVFVQIDSIDGRGGTLGQAGPCYIRSATGIPILGVIHLDRDDLAWMLERGTALSVVTHELGHVLGIGTIWSSSSRPLIAGAGTDDPRFTGAAAAEGARALGFPVPGGVAVENTGGPGTRDGHWRESAFVDELMTGWASAHAPLSLLTVRSLEDLGYTVTELATEPFSATRLHGVTATTTSARTVRIADVPLRPTWVIDPEGRARKMDAKRARSGG